MTLLSENPDLTTQQHAGYEDEERRRAESIQRMQQASQSYESRLSGAQQPQVQQQTASPRLSQQEQAVIDARKQEAADAKANQSTTDAKQESSNNSSVADLAGTVGTAGMAYELGAGGAAAAEIATPSVVAINGAAPVAASGGGSTLGTVASYAWPVAAVAGAYLGTQNANGMREQLGRNLTEKERLRAYGPHMTLGTEGTLLEKADLYYNLLGNSNTLRKIDPSTQVFKIVEQFLGHESTKERQAKRANELASKDSDYASFMQASTDGADTLAQSMERAKSSAPAGFTGWVRDPETGVTSWLNGNLDAVRAEIGEDQNDPRYLSALGSGDVLFMPWLFENIPGYGKLTASQKAVVCDYALKTGTQHGNAGNIDFTMTPEQIAEATELSKSAPAEIEAQTFTPEGAGSGNITFSIPAYPTLKITPEPYEKKNLSGIDAQSVYNDQMNQLYDLYAQQRAR